MNFPDGNDVIFNKDADINEMYIFSYRVYFINFKCIYKKFFRVLSFLGFGELL
jgi:hypothetical protein